MDADKNNIDELNKSVQESRDISYGGCRYRLSYDRYENPCSKKKTSVKVSSVLLTLGLVAVFVALGFFILRYYNSGVADYYDKRSDDAVTASFQSFLPIDISY